MSPTQALAVVQGWQLGSPLTEEVVVSLCALKVRRIRSHCILHTLLSTAMYAHTSVHCTIVIATDEVVGSLSVLKVQGKLGPR